MVAQADGPLPVIPAKAGIQRRAGNPWIPAFAGMTGGRIFMIPSAAHAA